MKRHVQLTWLMAFLILFSLNFAYANQAPAKDVKPSADKVEKRQIKKNKKRIGEAGMVVLFGAIAFTLAVIELIFLASAGFLVFLGVSIIGGIFAILAIRRGYRLKDSGAKKGSKLAGLGILLAGLSIVIHGIIFMST